MLLAPPAADADGGLAYKYHGVTMRARPIGEVPSVAGLAEACAEIKVSRQPRFEALVRRRFLDARRGEAEGIRLDQEGAESVATRPRSNISRILRVPAQWSISAQAEAASRKFGAPWNVGVDVVCYRDGRDSCGWHADDTQGETLVRSRARLDERREVFLPR